MSFPKLAFRSTPWGARTATALVFALAALTAAWASHALARHPGASFLTAPPVLLLAAAHAALAAAWAHGLLVRVAWPWAALWGAGVAVFSALATAAVLGLSITEVSASPWAKASAAALFVALRLVADPRLSGPILLAGAGAALVARAVARHHSWYGAARPRSE